MEPFWAKHPDMHPFSIGWRMGQGETDKQAFWEWWDAAPEAATEDSRLAYVKSHALPPEWTHVALEMIWPDKIPGDGFEFFFHKDTAIIRGALFKHGETHGLPSMMAWIKGLDRPVD